MNIKRLMVGIALPALTVAALAFAPPGAAAAPAERGEVEGVRTVVKIAQPATAAQAAQLDLSVQNDSHGCSGDEVSNNSFVHVCFVRDGDTVWVRDNETNNRSAVGHLEYYDAGSWYFGYCVNSHTHASGIWVSCGFPEADENTTVYYRGYDKDDISSGNWTSWQPESTT